jgi:two-component system sensor histidine kinase YesM
MIDKNSISIKLTGVIFILLFGSLFSLTWVNYRNNTNAIMNNQEVFMRSMIQQSNDEIDNLFNALRELLLSAADNIKSSNSSDVEIEQLLKSYSAFNEYAKYFYFTDDSQHLVGFPIVPVRVLGQFSISQVAEYAQQNPLGIWWTKPYKSSLSNWVVTIGLNFVSDDNAERQTVAIDIPLLDLRNILPKIEDGGLMSFLVMTDDTPVMANHQSKIYKYNLLTNEISDSTSVIVNQVLAERPETMIVTTSTDNPYLVMAGDVNTFGWRSILISDNHPLESTLMAAKKTSIFLLVAVFIVSLLLAWFVARWFSMPIRELASEMERVDLDQLHGIRIPKRNDEIGKLALTFDKMLSRIRSLVLDLKNTERMKKDAEIRALQYQIRPHFLYNTLNSIGHLASLGRTQDVYETIQSLTKMLSYTLDKANGTVMLAEELEHIDNYLRLQKIRYGDIFNVQYNIEPGVGKYEILKFSLQPIVENAIFHGLSNRSLKGVLKINATIEKDRLNIQIIDNGPGIPAERLKELENTAPNEGSGGIGLRVVRERLALNYGDEAEFHIQTLGEFGTPQAGTAISISIPAIHMNPKSD